MERVPLQPEFGHLSICDLYSCRIGVRVEIALHGQACPGGRAGDEVDDDFMADQRPASPVLADKREQPVFDLVPFTRARRKVAD